MAAIRTEITEIVTGLAMLGFRSLDEALLVRPTSVVNLTTEHYERLDSARQAGTHDVEFDTAWDNGRIFARADDGLRGRPPWTVEWKGPHKPPGYEQVPADLRIDHVYLVSCKYGSSILHNASPSHLFERSLAERRVERGRDWFLTTAPEAYQEFYQACLLDTGLIDRAPGTLASDAAGPAVPDGLTLSPGDTPGPAVSDGLADLVMPTSVAELDKPHRLALKAALPKRGRLPEKSQQAYEQFSMAVSFTSAERWREHLTTPRERESMLWRLLRLQAAPYFVLGATTGGDPLRYRVGTPWDFRSRFEVKSFDAWPDAAGQPMVRWRAEVAERPGFTDRRKAPSAEGAPPRTDRHTPAPMPTPAPTLTPAAPGATGQAERPRSKQLHLVEGHVEIRWTHGRFSGAPEAKVHLDTHPHDVPGYFPLT